MPMVNLEHFLVDCRPQVIVQVNMMHAGFYSLIKLENFMGSIGQKIEPILVPK